MKKVKYASPLLVVVGLLLIASSMSYEQQDLRGYLHLLPLSWVEDTFGILSFTYSSGTVSIESKGAAGFIEFFIRKGTHLFMYGCLAMFGYLALKPYPIKAAWKMAIVFLFAAAFAAIDELRHFYNPDRTGLWQDVVLDMTGAVIGMLIVLWLKQRRKSGRREEKTSLEEREN